MRTEKLSIYGQTINYTVRVSDRAQRLRVAVYADGDVIVTKPKGTKLSTLKHFVESKKDWIAKKLESHKTNTIPELRITSDKHFEKHKNQSLKLVRQKVEHWNKELGYEFENINVKQLKSRWGSCSSKKNLNFNYKILYLPEQLQDYVIVHELCHLKQLNHSPKFWNLVASILPDYSDLKSNIRTI